MGSAFGDAETVVTRWMRFWCKDGNIWSGTKCIWRFPEASAVSDRPAAPPCPAGLVLVNLELPSDSFGSSPDECGVS